MDRKRMGTWIALAFVSGCGGGQEQPANQSEGVDPRLQKIMDYEAEIAQGKEEMAGLSGDCTNLCRISHDICSDSEQICTVADDMREPDSRQRCDKSKQDCTGQRTVATNQCGGCQGAPDVPGYAGPMD